jgi:undecaprenyl-diphosphatase
MSTLEQVVASDLADDPTRNPAAEPERAVVTAERRRRWGKQASLASVSLGALGSFLVAHRAITGARGNAFDAAVMRAMGRTRRPLFNAIVRAVTWLGSVRGAVSVSLAAIAVTRGRLRLSSQIALGATGGIASELFFKRLFLRERPRLLEHLENVRSSSFPSGHAMASASLYLTLAFVAGRGREVRRHRAALIAGGSAVAATIGATRVYLGVHWPTDVIGGLALGTAWACGTEALFDLTGARRLEQAVTGTESR